MVLVPVAQMMEIARRRHASVTLPAKHSAKKSKYVVISTGTLVCGGTLCEVVLPSCPSVIFFVSWE